MGLLYDTIICIVPAHVLYYLCNNNNPCLLYLRLALSLSFLQR